VGGILLFSSGLYLLLKKFIMYYSLIVISLTEVVLVFVPALLGIAAYVTIAEIKSMASMQR
jgi:hypothetical protein